MTAPWIRRHALGVTCEACGGTIRTFVETPSPRTVTAFDDFAAAHGRMCTPPARYSWSLDQDRYEGNHACREDAIAEARTSVAGEASPEVVWTGRRVEPQLRVPPRDLVHPAIEVLQEAAADDFGELVPENWPDTTVEAEEKLAVALAATIDQWAEEYARPTWWTVTDVVRHDLRAVDGAAAAARQATRRELDEALDRAPEGGR